MGVSGNSVPGPIVPNGFADHYPYEKLLFHWEYSPNIFRQTQILLAQFATSHHQPSPAITSHHQPSPAITSHHQPSPAITSHHQPSPAITSHHQPSPAITSHRRHSPAALPRPSPSSRCFRPWLRSTSPPGSAKFAGINGKKCAFTGKNDGLTSKNEV